MNEEGLKFYKMESDQENDGDELADRKNRWKVGVFYKSSNLEMEP